MSHPGWRSRYCAHCGPAIQGGGPAAAPGGGLRGRVAGGMTSMVPRAGLRTRLAIAAGRLSVDVVTIATANRALAGVHVLVVEDDRSIGEQLVRGLSRAGCRVDLVGSAAAA